jgi:quercetin dioxygenase-like cupin family protein
MSAFHELSDLAPIRIWDGVIARAVAGQEATLAAIELAADAAVPEHSHVNEQSGLLLSGSVTFTIGGESKALQPGAAWVIPAHVPHSVTVGPDGAQIVEIFAPPRSDWAELERLDPSSDAARLGLG